MTSEERTEYKRAILAAVYGSQDEAELRASNADVSIVMKWADEGHALAWILRGIEEMPSKPASVRHARPAVEQEVERCHRSVS